MLSFIVNQVIASPLTNPIGRLPHRAAGCHQGNGG
jgi:hypothetical protein